MLGCLWSNFCLCLVPVPCVLSFSSPSLLPILSRALVQDYEARRGAAAQEEPEVQIVGEQQGDRVIQKAQKRQK